jgi:hypothetical protein
MKYAKTVAAASALVVLVTGPTALAAAKAKAKPAKTTTIAAGTIQCKNQYKGKTVNIFSPVRDSATDTAATQRRDAYAPFEKCTGAKVKFEGTDQFETQVNVRLAGGNAPDLIEFPQPGLLQQIAAKGQHKMTSSPAGSNTVPARTRRFTASRRPPTSSPSFGTRQKPSPTRATRSQTARPSSSPCLTRSLPTAEPHGA